MLSEVTIAFCAAERNKIISHQGHAWCKLPSCPNAQGHHAILVFKSNEIPSNVSGKDGNGKTAVEFSRQDKLKHKAPAVLQPLKMRIRSRIVERCPCRHHCIGLPGE